MEQGLGCTVLKVSSRNWFCLVDIFWGQGIDLISDMAASRVVFLSKLKTWSAHVCGVKSAPAATCKQQVVPSVHVRVCLIVQPGISRAGLGTFCCVKYRPSGQQIPG